MEIGKELWWEDAGMRPGERGEVWYARRMGREQCRRKDERTRTSAGLHKVLLKTLVARAPLTQHGARRRSVRAGRRLATQNLEQILAALPASQWPSIARIQSSHKNLREPVLGCQVSLFSRHHRSLGPAYDLIRRLAASRWSITGRLRLWAVVSERGRRPRMAVWLAAFVARDRKLCCRQCRKSQDFFDRGLPREWT